MHTGHLISLEIHGQRFLLNITGVDISKPKGDEGYFVGLHLGNQNEETQIDLKTVKLQKQKAEVFE